MSNIVSEAAIFAQAEARSKDIKKHMSPAGALGLPPLLDERRLRYGIVDEAFKIQPAFRRVFLRQIEEWEGETYAPESKIIRTENAKKRDYESMPRGVLIGAGLEAREVLHSHGIDLGDIVWMVQLGLYRIPIVRINGKDEHILVLQVGDIVGGEDTAARIRSGDLQLVHDRRALEGGFDRNDFLYARKDGYRTAIKSPWTPDDF